MKQRHPHPQPFDHLCGSSFHATVKRRACSTHWPTETYYLFHQEKIGAVKHQGLNKQMDLCWNILLLHVTCYVIKWPRSQVSHLKGHHHDLITEWQFTRNKRGSAADPLQPHSATGEQVSSRIPSQDPLRNQGSSRPTWTISATLLHRLGNTLSQKNTGSDTPELIQKPYSQELSQEMSPPQKHSLSAPSASTQTSLTDKAVMKMSTYLNSWDCKRSKFHLVVQESPKQHLKTMHTSAIKNKPTTKSHILWTKPGKPPLRDTQLSDPAKSKLSLNYQTTEVSLNNILASKHLFVLGQTWKGLNGTPQALLNRLISQALSKPRDIAHGFLPS